jgi:hypothetical protein
LDQIPEELDTGMIISQTDPPPISRRPSEGYSSSIALSCPLAQGRCDTGWDNGAIVTKLEAIFDWQGGRVAALYTQATDRKRASLRAMTMLERTDYDTSMDSPG